MSEIPFPCHQEGNLLHIDPGFDRRFRAALEAGAPVKVRCLMKAALSEIPMPGGLQRCQAYYGKELDAVARRALPLVHALDEYMETQLHLDGLIEWMDLTGYADDLGMLKALDAWSQLKKRAH